MALQVRFWGKDSSELRIPPLSGCQAVRPGQWQWHVGGQRMSTDPLRSRAAESSATGRIDSTGLPPSTAVSGAMGVGVPAVEVDVAEVPLRDRIRWGPIIAGVVTAFAVLLFLTVLGIALGVSALGGDDAKTWGTAAGIWGGLSLLVAFFFGGWMAARAAATLSESDGPLNGFITGAATLLLLLWLATTALTGALGFFASTVTNIAGAAAPVAMQAVDQGAVPPETQTAVDQAADNPEAAVDQAEQTAQQAADAASKAAGPGAWGTTIAIILAVGAATLGGMVGRNERMVLPRSRTVVATRYPSCHSQKR